MSKIELDGKTVLVTGASGFIASHVVKQLLELNCKVVGTVRSLNSPDIPKLKEAFGDKAKNLSFVEANLND